MRRELDYLCFQPTREGQASRAHVYEIVAGLRRRGWTVEVIEPPHPRTGRADALRRAFAAGGTQLRYWIGHRFKPARVVYIRTHFLSLPSAVVARLAGAIVVQEVNGAIDDVFAAWPALRHIRWLISGAIRLQLRWANAVITVTPGLADYYAALVGRQGGIHVVGNGANVDLFTPTLREETERRYAVFVGALAPWQGVEVALDAANSTDWPADVDLVIAGDGMGRATVDDASKTNPRVRWLGTIPQSQAAELTASSLAALVPMAMSARSGHGLSPLKLFEAMASGVPVVASDLPGLEDVVRAHDCGILYPPGDAGALARAVAQLDMDPGRAAEMGHRGREAAVANYSWDARAGQTEEILLQLEQEKPPARTPQAAGR